MKRDVFFITAILLCIILNQFASAEIANDTPITGNMVVDPVTGKLTSQKISMSIFIQTTAPFIQIISPKNNTYLKNESILLNYTITDGDYAWYNIDNSENITINYWTYFNASKGQHTLYMFSNKSENITSANITFTLNSSKFVILFDNYKGAYKGISTNFIDYSYEEIQGLNSIILENTNYGRVKFNEQINLTDDKINTDNILDIDSNVEISKNNIRLNSTELPNFNKSATIWLYNLSFTNPRILKDGEICPSSICIKESYSGGTLKFNVTHFTSYSTEETPSEHINPPSGGGSTSPSKEITQHIPPEETGENITIISPEINVSLKPGQKTSENVYFVNNYPQNMKIKINISAVKKFVTASETEFELPYGEIKMITFNFSVDENTPPDNYVGKILIETPGKTYEILTSIDVESKSSLFDVSLKLDQTKLPVSQGGSIWFTTSISNLGEKTGVDIGIKYTIKDSNGKIIFEGQGTEIIDKYLEKNGKIKLPKNIPPGKYVLSARVDYEGKTAISSASFEVQNKKLATLQNILLATIILLVILIILWRIGKKEKERKKEEQEEKRESSRNKK
jgi:hypothetical protein